MKACFKSGGQVDAYNCLAVLQEFVLPLHGRFCTWEPGKPCSNSFRFERSAFFFGSGNSVARCVSGALRKPSMVM